MEMEKEKETDNGNGKWCKKLVSKLLGFICGLGTYNDVYVRKKIYIYNDSCWEKVNYGMLWQVVGFTIFQKRSKNLKNNK